MFQVMLGQCLGRLAIWLPAPAQLTMALGAATTNAHWYTLGTRLTLWLSWQVSTAVGILLIARLDIPAEWGLDFILPLTFIALIVPMLADKAGWLTPRWRQA